MSCGLPYAALLILNELYRNHCFARDAGYHCRKLEHVISEKTEFKFNKIINKLMHEGYVGQLDKKEIKYYISDIKKATYALKEHDYSVVQGRRRKL